MQSAECRVQSAEKKDGNFRPFLIKQGLFYVYTNCLEVGFSAIIHVSVAVKGA